MKTINFLFFFISLSTFFSCKDKSKNEKQETYKVMLAFEPDFYNESSIYTVILSKPILQGTVKVENKDNNFVGHQFFNTERGEITISALSAFERNYSKTFNINSDTTVIFYKSDFAEVFKNKDKWDSDLMLKNIDTIVIWCSNGSCATTEEFASSREICFFKEDTNLVVKYTDLPKGSAEIKSSYKTKKLSNSFVPELRKFYLSAKKIKERKQVFESTVNAYLHIRVGNNIFHITDPNFAIWKHYDELIKAINRS